MGALGSKLRTLEGGLVSFWCPGCESPHHVRIDAAYGGAWGFNGNGDAPTFTPSVLVTGTQKLTEDEYRRVMAGDPINLAKDRPQTRCHSFVTDGRIQFLGDCTHKLAGQTLDLPNFDV